MYIHYNRRTYLGFFLNVKLCKIQDFVYNVMCTKQVNIQDKNTEIQEQKRYQHKQKFMQNAIGSHWYSDFLLRSDILWGFFFVFCVYCIYINLFEHYSIMYKSVHLLHMGQLHIRCEIHPSFCTCNIVFRKLPQSNLCWHFTATIKQ